MTKEERQVKILEQIEQDKEVNIRLLSNLLNVSEMTIRRDIKEIESMENDLFNKRYNIISAIKIENSHKIQIGTKAAQLLKQDDVCFIDTGSTTLQMVDDILNISNLTVQTCNAEVFSRIAHNKKTNVYFAGGFLHRNSQMCESRESIDFLKNNKSMYAFISAAGVDMKLGLTCANYYEVETKRTAIGNTKKMVLMVDSSKFGIVSSSYFGKITDVDLIITDDSISEEWIKAIKDKSIDLIITTDNK